MTSEALSMTFATLFSMQVDRRKLSVRPLREAFHIPEPVAAPSAIKPVTAHIPGANDPSRRLLLPAPAGTVKTEPSRLAEMKQDRRYPHLVWLQISNPKARTDGFVQLALEEVFRERADIAARLVGSKRKIYEGPYTFEVAEVKKEQVRALAKAHEKPAPRMDCIQQKSY